MLIFFLFAIVAITIKRANLVATFLASIFDKLKRIVALVAKIVVVIKKALIFATKTNIFIPKQTIYNFAKNVFHVLL